MEIINIKKIFREEFKEIKNYITNDSSINNIERLNEKENHLSKKKIYSKNYFNFVNKRSEILFRFILIILILTPISCYFTINIQLSTTEVSRLIDIKNFNKQPECKCKRDDSSSYNNNINSCINNNNKIIFSKNSNSMYTFVWYDNDFPSDMKGLFKNCHNIAYIEFDRFDFSKVTDTSEMFQNCTSLTSINFKNSLNQKSPKVMSMSYMFYNCSSLQSINLEYFNTSFVTDMSYMFTNCSKLSKLNLNHFITSKVEKMNNMFELCTSLTELNQQFDTSRVLNMEFMFSNCKSLSSINISNFDISTVTSMNSMFKGSSKLKYVKFSNYKTFSLVNMGSMFQSCPLIDNIDLSTFDTSSVLFMDNLFHDCASLKKINLSNFNTEKVIKMESMFQNCKSLKEINLNNFYTPSLRQMYNLFSGCTSVTEIKISQFDTFQVTNFANLFYDCNSLKSIDISKIFVTNMATNMSRMFCNCNTLKKIDLSDLNTKRVTDMNSLFKGCYSLISITLKNLENTLVEDMSKMFYDCKNLTSLIMENFGTNNVKNMEGMFHGCLGFTSLNLTKFSTLNVINMNSMFFGCSNLKGLDISSFNTSEVLDMNSMFYECSSLSSLNLSNFNTYKVKNFDSIFSGCKNLLSLSLNNFNSANAESMKSLFKGCSSLELLDLSNFNTKKVRYMDSFFYDCSSLIKLNLVNFTLTNVKSMGYMFYGCKALTSIDLPSFNKLSVINTTYMFYGCSSLIKINLSNFDSSHIIDMDYMFSGCSYLKELYLDNWNINQVVTMNYLFSGCSSLISVNLASFNSPNLKSIRGMFYSCYSLQSLNLTNFNTKKVTNMDYLFYKAFELKIINFTKKEYRLESSNLTNTPTSYFNTSLVESMRYMFAFCSKLEFLDLSFFNTSKVKDMSYMFKNCSKLTSLNLSSFGTNNVKSMDSMFFNCLNLSYINLLNIHDAEVDNINNILDETPKHMVVCIIENNAPKIYGIITNTKGGCFSIYCESDYLEHRKKLIIDDKGNSINKCTSLCKTEGGMFDYHFNCYKTCPEGTFPDDNEKADDYFCVPPELKPEKCTLQRVFLEKCEMDELETPFNNTNQMKEELIQEIINQFPTFDKLLTIIFEKGSFSKTIYNETYQFSLLSNKNKLDNLTFIDIQDCEYLIKKENNIEPNSELILFKIEYITDEFIIPIIEYTVLDKYGRRYSFNACESLNFIHSTPVNINPEEEYKYNPDSEYNNEICFQFTSENNNDIILYERRKLFNEYNMSLCENNCKYLGFVEKRIECQCPVRNYFNKFLLETQKEKDDKIFRFKNNDFQPFNFGVVKCFKMLFNKESFKQNYSNILFIVIIILNFVSALIFCVKGYKILYIQIRLLSEASSKEPDKKKDKNVKITNSKKKSIMTTANNPPPKIKADIKSLKHNGDLIVNKIEDNDKPNIKDSNLIEPSSLMDSKNIFKKGLGKDYVILEKKDVDDLSDYTLYKTDMETNMLSYSEALKTDKRGCFLFYFSFLKTRQLLICMFITDFNSIVIKLSFFFFVFGICLGINTIFIDDRAIQKIYEENKDYNIPKHIITHIMNIGISTIVASLIKSIVSFLAFTDVSILDVKVSKEISKDEKINKVIMRVSSKATAFFSLSIIVMSICWIYCGSFCSVFKNTQIYLFINAAISFGGVITFPFLYYLIPALLRSMALGGKNGGCLYRLSQFFELI